MQLSAERLRLLREIQTRGSIAAVARSVGHSPSAVSQQLRQLEREAGQQLLERSNQGVRLTPTGRVLADHAGRVMTELEAAASAISVRAPVSGRLTLGAFPSALETFVMDTLAKLSASVPDLELTLVHLEPERVLEALLSADIDLGVIHSYSHVPMTVSAELHTELLFEEPLGVIAPMNDPLAGCGAVDLVEFGERQWVISASDTTCGEAQRAACRMAGFEPDIRLVTEDHVLVHRFVAEAGMVAIVPYLGLYKTQYELARIPVHQSLSRTLYTATRRGLLEHPGVNAVCQAMREAAPSYRPR